MSTILFVILVFFLTSIWANEIMLFPILLFFLLCMILIYDIGIYHQKKYFLGDAYELMKTYSINTKARIKYKYTCFLYSGRHRVAYKCKFGISSDYIYIKLLPEPPSFFQKPLRLQIPKKDLEFWQREKFSRLFLFFASRSFCENNYNRYKIVNSTVSIYFKRFGHVRK
jgi:hypothetical protein